MTPMPSPTPWETTGHSGTADWTMIAGPYDEVISSSAGFVAISCEECTADVTYAISQDGITWTPLPEPVTLACSPQTVS